MSCICVLGVSSQDRDVMYLCVVYHDIDVMYLC